jgi:hypothetical protein
MVWKALMSNRECGQAMELAGFKMENGTSPAEQRRTGTLVAAGT